MPASLRLAVELGRTVHIAVVGHRDVRHAVAPDLFEQLLQAGGAVQHRIFGMHVKVRERPTWLRGLLGLTGRGFRHGTKPPPSGMLRKAHGPSQVCLSPARATRACVIVTERFPGGRRHMPYPCARGSTAPRSRPPCWRSLPWGDRADPVNRAYNDAPDSGSRTRRDAGGKRGDSARIGLVEGGGPAGRWPGSGGPGSGPSGSFGPGARPWRPRAGARDGGEYEERRPAAPDGRRGRLWLMAFTLMSLN